MKSRLAKGIECLSSGAKTSSGAVVTEDCYFHGIVATTDGSHDVTVTPYNSDTNTAGTEILPTGFKIPATNNYGGLFVPHPVRCKNGIYVLLSGSGGSFCVYYSN